MKRLIEIDDATLPAMVKAAMPWLTNLSVMRKTDKESHVEEAIRAAIAAAPAVPDARAVADERAAFEAYWNDDTTGPEALSAWCGWKARAALASPAPASDDARDAERLDFLISETAAVVPVDNQFQLEWLYLYAEQGESYKTGREAIDDAIAAERTGGNHE